MRRLIVLGGSGFVGSHVVRKARQLGLEPTIASRAAGWDLLDLHRSTEMMKQIEPDVVINCAAHVGSVNFVTERAAEIADLNMRIQLNVFRSLAEAAPGALLINPVANCAYPGYLEVYSEEQLWNGPLHPSVASYGSTRRMMVTLSECYSRQKLLNVVNLLVPNMFGPYDSPNPDKAHALNALAAKTIKAQREDCRQLDVWGTGSAVREWLFAGDFARVAFELIHRSDLTNAGLLTVNIGQRRGLSVKELVALIVEEAGFIGEVVWDPSKPEGAPRKVMDDGQFRFRFPDFQFTDVRVGLRSTLQYYRETYPY